jgi:hypothetical protein
MTRYLGTNAQVRMLSGLSCQHPTLLACTCWICKVTDAP